MERTPRDEYEKTRHDVTADDIKPKPIHSLQSRAGFKILLDDNGKVRVQQVDTANQRNTKTGKFTDEYGSIRQIALWLDKGSGEIMKRANEFLEEGENLTMIRDHLQKNQITKQWVQPCLLILIMNYWQPVFRFHQMPLKSGLTLLDWIK